MGSEHTNPELADTIWKLEHDEPLVPIVIPAAENYFPGYILGAQATAGTMWWLATFLLYLKNKEDDADLIALNGGTIFPIGWFWERVAESNGLYNYFAMSLMANFFMYALVSAVEFCAFIIYVNGDPYFAAFWFSMLGYYGSIFGLPLPWIFSAVYISETMDGVTDVFPGNWCVFMLVMTLIMWVVIAGLHIYYVPSFLEHIATIPPRPCQCSLPNVEPVGDDASELLKSEYTRAAEEREALCLIQCPPKAECPLSKEDGQSDAEYAAACAALENNADKEDARSALPEEEDFEDDDII